MIDYFSLHDFSIAVSIDGGKDVQNRQRPLKNGKNSFYETTKNLKYLFKKIQNTHARGTYYDFDGSLVKSYIDLLELGFKEVNIPPDILDIKNMSDMNKVLKQLDDLYEYILNYVYKNKDFPFGLFITKLRRLFLPRIIADYGCGLGRYTIAVDISGNVFPCHRYSSNPSAVIGTINDIPVTPNPTQRLHISHKCMSCWNQYTCSHGCSYNDDQIANCARKKSPYWCIYSKKMTELCLMLATKLPEEQLAKIIHGNNNV